MDNYVQTKDVKREPNYQVAPQTVPLHVCGIVNQINIASLLRVFPFLALPPPDAFFFSLS